MSPPICKHCNNKESNLYHISDIKNWIPQNIVRISIDELQRRCVVEKRFCTHQKSHLISLCDECFQIVCFYIHFLGADGVKLITGDG